MESAGFGKSPDIEKHPAARANTSGLVHGLLGLLSTNFEINRLHHPDPLCTIACDTANVNDSTCWYSGTEYTDPTAGGLTGGP